MPLDVDTIASVCILVIPKIPEHLLHVLRAERLLHAACHVAGNDHAGHQEHGPAIVPRPVAVVLLELLVEANGGHQRLLQPVVRELCFMQLIGRHSVRVHAVGARRLGVWVASYALQAEQLIAAVLLGVARGLEALPGLLDRLALVRGASGGVEVPDLPPSEAVQRGQMGVPSGVVTAFEPPHCRNAARPPLPLRSFPRGLPYAR